MICMHMVHHGHHGHELELKEYSWRSYCTVRTVLYVL